MSRATAVALQTRGALAESGNARTKHFSRDRRALGALRRCTALGAMLRLELGLELGKASIDRGSRLGCVVCGVICQRALDVAVLVEVQSKTHR